MSFQHEDQHEDQLAQSDAALIRASRSDAERFGVIFDRHAVAVHAFLARRCRPELADDLLGEVFTVAFDLRRRFEPGRAGGESARPWLFGIAHNVLRARLRREGTRRGLLRRVPVESAENPWDDVDHRLDADGPGTRAITAMASLPPGERDVVQLVAWEGLSLAEVAATLRIPQGTARSRLHRARTALRAVVGVPHPEEKP